jgi:hypothetical protein
VNFNGAALATGFSSATVLSATVPAADIAAQGTASISVTTPSNGVPGGGTSGSVTLTILPLETQPVVLNISPTSATGGGPAFTLTVNGSGFVQGSQVSFNANNVVTTFVSSTQLTAAIPAGAIAIVGYPNVIVMNPGGLSSVPFSFTVINPQPGGGMVTPPSLPAGSNAFTLSVTGTGFTQTSAVYVNGIYRITTFVSSTLLQATLLPSDLAQGGTLDITVMNPPPGGGTTGVISFTVADYSVVPPSSTPPVTAGQTAMFALTVSSSHGTFSNPVTFSVSTLPTGATASFSPSAPVTPGATPQTVMLSINTTPHTETSAIHLPPGFHPGLPLLCLLGVVFVLACSWLWAAGGRMRRLAPQLLLAMSLLVAGSMLACGAVGAGNSTSPQVNPATGTPAGTYPITVTATSGGVSHSATVTLTVM